jgi:hypothetical protein
MLIGMMWLPHPLLLSLPVQIPLPLDIRVNEHQRNWLKLDREREEWDEAATSSLLASHTVEHNHQVNWEEVTILAKESNIRKRKINEAAVMHIEDNVISQPSIDIPPLWHYSKKREEKDNKRKKIKRRSSNKVNKQDRRGMKKRGSEEECREESTKRPALTVSTAKSSLVDRRHLYHLRLRRHMPVCLIECN